MKIALGFSKINAMFASFSADLPGYSDGPVDPHLSSQQPRRWGVVVGQSSLSGGPRGLCALPALSLPADGVME